MRKSLRLKLFFGFSSFLITAGGATVAGLYAANIISFPTANGVEKEKSNITKVDAWFPEVTFKGDSGSGTVILNEKAPEGTKYTYSVNLNQYNDNPPQELANGDLLKIKHEAIDHTHQVFGTLEKTFIVSGLWSVVPAGSITSKIQLTPSLPATLEFIGTDGSATFVLPRPLHNRNQTTYKYQVEQNGQLVGSPTYTPPTNLSIGDFVWVEQEVYEPNLYVLMGLVRQKYEVVNLLQGPTINSSHLKELEGAVLTQLSVVDFKTLSQKIHNEYLKLIDYDAKVKTSIFKESVIDEVQNVESTNDLTSWNLTLDDFNLTALQGNTNYQDLDLANISFEFKFKNFTPWQIINENGEINAIDIVIPVTGTNDILTFPLLSSLNPIDSRINFELKHLKSFKTAWNTYINKEITTPLVFDSNSFNNHAKLARLKEFLYYPLLNKIVYPDIFDSLSFGDGPFVNFEIDAWLIESIRASQITNKATFMRNIIIKDGFHYPKDWLIDKATIDQNDVYNLGVSLSFANFKDNLNFDLSFAQPSFIDTKGAFLNNINVDGIIDLSKFYKIDINAFVSSSIGRVNWATTKSASDGTTSVYPTEIADGAFDRAILKNGFTLPIFDQLRNFDATLVTSKEFADFVEKFLVGARPIVGQEWKDLAADGRPTFGSYIDTI